MKKIISACQLFIRCGPQLFIVVQLTYAGPSIPVSGLIKHKHTLCVWIVLCKWKLAAGLGYEAFLTLSVHSEHCTYLHLN